MECYCLGATEKLKNEPTKKNPIKTKTKMLLKVAYNMAQSKIFGTANGPKTDTPQNQPKSHILFR